MTDPSYLVPAKTPLEKEVRKILNLEWDPIGLDIDADDEYWQYARHIAENAWNQNTLVAYLAGIGLDSGSERKKIISAVADKLLTLPTLQTKS